MRIYGKVDYTKLYKMLRNIDGEFELCISHGKTYSGRWDSPELWEMLLSAESSLKNDVTLVFKDNFKALRGLKYLTAHNIA